jgi:hypothetical protein
MWEAMKPFAPVTKTVEPFSIAGMVCSGDVKMERMCSEQEKQGMNRI